MELIDEIMMNISDYVIDPMAVSNSLYITLQDYDIQKKSTELAVYQPEDNELLIKKFLVAKKTKGCTNRTLQFYRAEVMKMLARIGKPVVDITTDDIRLYIAKRIRDGVSNTTIGNEKRAFSSFLTYLHGEDIIRKNPMVAIDTMKQKKTQKEAFKDEEVVKMRDQLRNTRERAIFEILLSTGCRVSELVNIKLDEIQDDYSILVHGKGQKDRYVYLNAQAKYAYEKYMADRKDDSIYLFPKMVSIEDMDRKFVPKARLNEWYKSPEFVEGQLHTSQSCVETIIRNLGRKVGVKAYPHKFRRTCATNALRNGMPIEMVSRMLGHANLSTTQIYLDLNDEQMKMMHQRYVR